MSKLKLLLLLACLNTGISHCGLGDEWQALVNSEYIRKQTPKENVRDVVAGLAFSGALAVVSNTLSKMPNAPMQGVGWVLRWFAVGMAVATNAFGSQEQVEINE